jgi:hypothetical protein
MACTLHGCNQLAAAGSYFTNQSDVFRCAFCGVEVGHRDEGDDASKEHQRWSPSCGFGKGLCVGNTPNLSNDQPEKYRIGLPEAAMCVDLVSS